MTLSSCPSGPCDFRKCGNCREFVMTNQERLLGDCERELTEKGIILTRSAGSDACEHWLARAKLQETPKKSGRHRILESGLRLKKIVGTALTENEYIDFVKRIQPKTVSEALRELIKEGKYGKEG